jgi:predicted nucleic acid-binding protein
VSFVLDASVALSWLLEDAGPRQAYAVGVFDALKHPSAAAHVPATWGLELANVIAKSEARGVLLENRSQVFLSALAAAPIHCDPETYPRACAETLQLARRYGLSSYDASYLELALRLKLPLATHDADLLKAAKRTGVRRWEAK